MWNVSRCVKGLFTLPWFLIFDTKLKEKNLTQIKLNENILLADYKEERNRK